MARSLARHFGTSEIIVIGSQATIVHGDEAALIASDEFDAYPGNAREWERMNPGFEASEEVNALFGEGSQFAVAYGFYVDGVDEETARLPSNWRERACRMSIADGENSITIIAPSLIDLIVSKLFRFEAKDREFARLVSARHEIDVEAIKATFLSLSPNPDHAALVLSFLDGLNSVKRHRSP